MTNVDELTAVSDLMLEFPVSYRGVDRLRDRYRGCLLGLAIGDALGAPLEFMDRAAIAERYGVVSEMLGGGWLHTEPGEVTDDTQMALAIARSIAAQGSVDPEDIARRFVEWFDTDPKDIGNTTIRSLRHLAEGVPWNEAGENTLQELGGSAPSNGSLMRSAPIALACVQNEELLRRHSIDVSRITHADPEACWACVSLDLAISALVGERGDALQSAANVPESSVSQAVIRSSSIDRAEVRSGGRAIETLGAAVWAFRHYDGFEGVVVAAVNLGGDADTTGAVAGALAGARYGASAIPDRWLATLQVRDELIALADQLHDLS